LSGARLEAADYRKGDVDKTSKTAQSTTMVLAPWDNEASSDSDAGEDQILHHVPGYLSNDDTLCTNAIATDSPAKRLRRTSSGVIQERSPKRFKSKRPEAEDLTAKIFATIHGDHSISSSIHDSPSEALAANILDEDAKPILDFEDQIMEFDSWLRSGAFES
jgi:hypothetical protein